MVVDIAPGWISAGVSVCGLVAGAAGFVIRNSFEARDEKLRDLAGSVKEAQEKASSDLTAAKMTQKLLFDKFDVLNHELQSYKLHVAETYVNREVLREQLAPLVSRIEELKADIKDLKTHGG